MRMIFIFIDGLGIGEKDGNKNPVYGAPAPNLMKLFDEVTYAKIDVTMDVKGLPQSATGQTAIFTGQNAAKAINRHLNGQPTVTLRKIINEGNLFRELISKGFRVTNANVYRDKYLENMITMKDRRLMPSVTTVMCMAENIPFRKVKDFDDGNGVYHDLTGNLIKESGYDINTITAEESAERLYKISRAYDFTLYEHFLTDIVGHKADIHLGNEHIKHVDKFLGRLLELIDEEDVVFITSDHGNIEDCSKKTHTMNLVPAWIIGKVEYCNKALDRMHSITDIMDGVLTVFEDAERYIHEKIV